jgi:hypothetical protein
MKVEYSDDIVIVYLNYVEEDIDNLCFSIVKKLNNYYSIVLKGFYHVNVYIDNNYGTVIEYILEDRDLYIDYSKIDLHIVKYNTIFLLKLDDILDVDINKFIFYKDNYYIKMTNLNILIMDFINIVYKNTDEIINNGIIMCKY